MKLETDFTQLTHYAEDVKHPAFEAFKKAMENRSYGGEALDDAWAWFATGWEAK